MSQWADTELLQRLKEGDLQAYDAFFLRYYKLLCINAFFFLKDEQESKDLVQNFFIEIWERKLYMKIEGEIKGYLYRSIQNKCLNILRKQESDQKKADTFPGFAGHDQEEDLPESYYNSLNQAIKELPMQRREAIQMVYLDNKKYQEAADVMGISINSLKTHLKIGLKKLREQIKIKKD